VSGTPQALIQSYIQDSSTLAGYAVSAAELSKIAKYSDVMIAAVDFVPFADTGIAE